MKNICILGHFAYGQNKANGQTIKTQIVTESLESMLSKEQVETIDTCGGLKTLVKAPFQCLRALKCAENVAMFPAHNGLRIYGALLPLFRPFYKNRKLHYVVIGGWLASILENKPFLTKQLKKFDGIYVETNSMKIALEKMGFQNIFVMPNCKKLQILEQSELTCAKEIPYQLCTFSRVIREKGIEDAVRAVQAINEAAGKTVYSLNIYGPVDETQTEWFEKLQAEFPDYIQYGGVIPFDQSVEVLKNHFALLFPTRYYTEGVPGTIIDAYAAGVPVISSKWKNFGDVIEEGKTGLGFDFENTEQLTALLQKIAEQPELINSMKVDCLRKAGEFLPEPVLRTMVEKL